MLFRVAFGIIILFRKTAQSYLVAVFREGADLSYCYKINQINNSEVDIPVIKSDSTIQATICNDIKIPKEMKEFLEKRPGQSTLKLAENLKSDEELLSLYNVKIAKDHFIYRGSEGFCV